VGGPPRIRVSHLEIPVGDPGAFEGDSPFGSDCVSGSMHEPSVKKIEKSLSSAYRRTTPGDDDAHVSPDSW
jgi:hypothetical protein